MPRPFAITAASNSVFLDDERRGEARFTVSNQSGRSIEGRARVVVEEAKAEPWVTLRGAVQRAFATAGTEQYTMEIEVPPDAPSGNYTVRLDMVGEERPDEQYVEGPTVTFEVPEPEPQEQPFPWMVVVVIAAVLLIGGGVLAFGILNGNGNDSDVSVSASFTVEPEEPNVGDEVRLDATESTVTGADDPTYAWSLFPPGESETTIDDPQAEITRFTVDVRGNYAIGLTVSADGVSDNRTVSIEATRTETVLEEDCQSFRPGELSIVRVRDHRDGETEIRWGIRGGGLRKDFDRADEAQRALDVIRRYNLNNRCIIGRPVSMEYWLINERAPQGELDNEDCLVFDRNNLELRQDGDRWVLTDGRRSAMISFPDEEQGRMAIQVIEKYQFTHTCYIGRPNPPFTYLRR